MANAYGGITEYVLENWRYIDRERFQFDFATLSKSKLFFEDEVTAQGCKVFYISCYAEENKEQFSNEVKKIFAEGYDVVHLHTSYWKSFLVEELAREVGIPKIIIHAHNTSVLEGDNREERIAHHKQCVMNLRETLASDYWACSRAAAEWLYDNKIPNEKIVIQKNAIDLDKFRYKKETALKIRKELGWENQFIIGHVGRFSYLKNHEFLINVFRKVYEKNPDTRLLLVGVGPKREKIESMICDWKLTNAVKILEKRNDVNDLMKAMDCFLLPSLYEGLPIVLIEAQASGCVCLASDSITEEVALTDSLYRLPLDEEKWINEIIFISESHRQRFIMNADVLRRCGYDLKDQIKKIEEGYLL